MTGKSQNIDFGRADAAGPGRTASAAWVNGALSLFASMGLDTEQLLDRAGIDKRVLRSPDGRVKTEKFSALWRFATEASGDEALGLARPQMLKAENFDIVAYAMLSSANLRTALQAFARYLRLVSDAAKMTVVDRGEGGLRVSLAIDGGSEPLPRQRVDFALITFITFCQWVTGHAFRPRAAMIAFPEPRDPRLYADAFGCAVTFGADMTAVDIDADVLDAPLPGHNPRMESLHHDLVSRQLAQIAADDIAMRVEEAVRALLVKGPPRREEVARALATSDRTLERRLHKRGLTFQHIVDETRRRLARQLLARPDTSNAEIAYLLGFTEQSVFFRACRRWFNASPGQVRRSLRCDAGNELATKAKD